MMILTVALLSVFAPSSLGSNPPHRHPAGLDPRACPICDRQSVQLARDLAILYTSRDWGDREEAAEVLADYSWRAHPEVVDALVSALLRDPHGEVREEAAKSLRRLAPCLPAAHLALIQAARADRDKGTRREAVKALKSLPHRCTSACVVCDGIEVRTARPSGTFRVEIAPPVSVEPPLEGDPIFEPVPAETHPSPPPPPQPGPFETRKVAPRQAEPVPPLPEPPLPEPPLELPTAFPPLEPPKG